MKTRWVWLAGLAVLSVIVSLFGDPPKTQTPDPHPDPDIDQWAELADVTRVIDKVTLEVRFKDTGKKRKIRLALIDPPEPDQPYGREAVDYVKKECEGKQAILMFDETKYDREGNLVMYVSCMVETVQENLAENGLARTVSEGKWVSGKAGEIREAEAEARRKKLGIWQVEGYVRQDGYHPEAVQEHLARAEQLRKEEEAQRKRQEEERKKRLEEMKKLSRDPKWYLTWKQEREALRIVKKEDYDCNDFRFQEQAQAFLILDRGNDRHHLDADGNGVACEHLPRMED